MDFVDIAKKRCSVRSYTKQPVEAEKLERILEAAHVAPTAANLQPVHLIVVQSEEGLSKLGKSANIYGAPLAQKIQTFGFSQPHIFGPLPAECHEHRPRYPGVSPCPVFLSGA